MRMNQDHVASGYFVGERCSLRVWLLLNGHW